MATFLICHGAWSAGWAWKKVRPLLRACLERDPLKRLRDIADYRFLLAPPEAPARIRRSPARSLLIAAAVLTTVILAFFAGKSLTRDAGASAPQAPIRLSTMLPAGSGVACGPLIRATG